MKIRKVLIHDNFLYSAVNVSNGYSAQWLQFCQRPHSHSDCVLPDIEHATLRFPGLSEQEFTAEFTSKHLYELRSVHTWTDLLIDNTDTRDLVAVKRIITMYI